MGQRASDTYAIKALLGYSQSGIMKWVRGVARLMFASQPCRLRHILDRCRLISMLPTSCKLQIVSVQRRVGAHTWNLALLKQLLKQAPAPLPSTFSTTVLPPSSSPLRVSLLGLVPSLSSLLLSPPSSPPSTHSRPAQFKNLRNGFRRDLCLPPAQLSQVLAVCYGDR